jgi:glycosyltransferase involved in cell wall biosynthesis
MTPQSSSHRVLFSSTLFTPFIEEDALILARHYPMEKLIASGLKALLALPGAVWRSTVTFSWFGSVYAGYTVFLSRVMRKKSVVVVAGIDASKDREINYGIFLNPWKAPIVRYAYRHADKVLVVDPFLQKEVIRLAEYDGANIVNVPFGFDDTRWYPGTGKEPLVVTVAACHDEDRMRKKGLDKLFDAARALPDVRFCVIGIHEGLLPLVAFRVPPNVELIAYVPRDGLLPYLQRAKVYCQPSFTEGLPNALCEAMLCACIPVGTTVGGIPTAIGDAGYLVRYGDAPALVQSLRRALNAPAAEGDRARARIKTKFTLPKREEALRGVLDTLALG